MTDWIETPEGYTQHLLWLKDLNRPDDAARYVWAPKGDMAFALCSRDLWNASLGPRSRGWQTFRYALRLPMSLDPTPENTTAMDVSSAVITLTFKRFRHERYPAATGLRFIAVRDQELYLEHHPSLAIPRDPPGRADGTRENKN